MDNSDQPQSGYSKPDGSIIKSITKPVRLFASLFLSINAPFFAIQITAIGLFLLCAYLATVSDIYLIVAGIIFVIASQLNQSAELITSNNQAEVQNYKVISIVIRYFGYTTFFSACGIAAYLENSANLYLISVSFVVILWSYLTILLTKLISSDTLTMQSLVLSNSINELRKSTPCIWERRYLYFYPMVRFESVPLVVLIASAFNTSGLLFWCSTAALILSIIVILRLLGRHNTDEAHALRRSVITFIFYLFGAAILLYLVLRLPIGEVMEAINSVGGEVTWLIFFPAVWAIPNAMTLMVLLDYRISFFDALYTQLSGDGFNGITPLLGMGGEPYKAKHLSRFVPLQDSSRAIVQSRLIHALSGVIYTAVILTICLLLIDFSNLPGLKVALIVFTIVMVIATVLILWLTMSKAPTQFTGFILSKFKLIEDFRHDPLSWSKLLVATSYRLVGRTGRFLELYIIFLVLEIIPSFADLVLVQGMIMASVNLFFFVPQGLGVNEAGIVSAFDIIGYAAATAVVFGLIRRARMVVYTLTGLIVYAAGMLFYARKPDPN
ncbi:MAG: hypothetical protein ACI9XC_000157 [Gammaproteobacteria bacterium]|jgi:hypothetical protein